MTGMAAVVMTVVVAVAVAVGRWRRVAAVAALSRYLRYLRPVVAFHLSTYPPSHRHTLARTNS